MSKMRVQVWHSCKGNKDGVKEQGEGSRYGTRVTRTIKTLLGDYWGPC